MSSPDRSQGVAQAVAAARQRGQLGTPAQPAGQLHVQDRQGISNFSIATPKGMSPRNSLDERIRRCSTSSGDVAFGQLEGLDFLPMQSSTSSHSGDWWQDDQTGPRTSRKSQLGHQVTRGQTLLPITETPSLPASATDGLLAPASSLAVGDAGRAGGACSSSSGAGSSASRFQAAGDGAAAPELQEAIVSEGGRTMQSQPQPQEPQCSGGEAPERASEPDAEPEVLRAAAPAPVASGEQTSLLESVGAGVLHIMCNCASRSPGPYDGQTFQLQGATETRDQTHR